MLKKFSCLTIALMLIFTLTTGCNPSQSEPDASGPALSADGSSDESVSEPKVKLTFWDENPGPVQTLSLIHIYL